MSHLSRYFPNYKKTLCLEVFSKQINCIHHGYGKDSKNQILTR